MRQRSYKKTGGGGDKKKKKKEEEEEKKEVGERTTNVPKYEAPQRELSSKYSPYAKPSDQTRIVDVKKRDTKSAGKSIDKRTKATNKVCKDRYKVSSGGKACKAIGKAAPPQFKDQK